MVWTCAHTLCNNDGPSLGWIMGGGEHIYIYIHAHLHNKVVPEQNATYHQREHHLETYLEVSKTNQSCNARAILPQYIQGAFGFQNELDCDCEEQSLRCIHLK